MKRSSYLFSLVLLIFAIGLTLEISKLAARETFSDKTVAESYPSDVISPLTWGKLDRSIESGLAWLDKNQNRDGSFPTLPTGQPAVTSLAVMAFMSVGHEPGHGEYGETLQSAIKFILTTQREDGLFSFVKPIQPVDRWHQATHTAMYNHAIAGLALTEAYGMSSGQDIEALTVAIERALEVTYREQRRPGHHKEDDGGWRYLKYLNQNNKGEADLSVTGWHLMFLRSAANAGFDVPEERVKAAAGYVRRSFDEKTNKFMYGVLPVDRTNQSRGMTGAGILSLAMAGEHNTEIARRAGNWLLEHPIDVYNPDKRGSGGKYHYISRFHYGVHYASHAMYQLGGRYWREFYPTMVETMLEGQLPSGAWQLDRSGGDSNFGQAYTTALAILSLTPPYQVLPIYQR